MRFFAALIVLACVSLCAGCAIHPLPEDYTGLPTHLIVRKVRCEARQALKDNMVSWLLTLETVDPRAYAVGVQYQSGRSLNEFTDKDFTGRTFDIIKEFENSAIAYDFTFDMSEVNNLDATVDILKSIPVMNTFTTAFTGGVDRTRENSRIFTISDTFVGLFKKIPDGYCTSIPSTGPNYMYPIVGTVGMGEMINNFVNLTLFDNLSGDPAKSGTPPTTADTLTFTTKLSGSAAPKIVLAPAGTAMQVADASFTALASRTDTHKLIVGLSLPPPPKAASRLAETSTPGLFATVYGTAAQKSAGAAVNQVYFRQAIMHSGAVLVSP